MENGQRLPNYMTNFDAFHSFHPSTFCLTDVINNTKRPKFGLNTKWNVDLCAINESKHAWQRDLKGHTSCVNAVEFNKTEDLFATGGDDLRVLIWRVANALTDESPAPISIMKKRHLSNIFALAFTHDSRKVLSAGNDDKFFVHDLETGECVQSYRGSTYYCLSVHAENDNIVAAATDNSRIYLYDIRAPPDEPVQCLREVGENYCVNFNQKTPYMMAVCNKTKGLSIVDIRHTDDYCIRAGVSTRGAIYASWNESGDALFCIRSGKLPVYFDTKKRVPLLCKDERYRNNVTIKSCDFIGNDYAITGSDKWDIYCWKIPKDYDDKLTGKKAFATHPQVDKAFTRFEGHRSIVNHCRYSKRDDIILSCGVEKIVKLWSGLKLQNSYKDPQRRAVMINTPLGEMMNMDEEDDNDTEEIHEDIRTLMLFDNYMREEGSIHPYSTDSEDNESVNDDFGPPDFITENPNRLRIGRAGTDVIRQLIHQMVAGELVAYGDSDNDEEDDNEEDDDDEAMFHLDSDEELHRFFMTASEESTTSDEALNPNINGEVGTNDSEESTQSTQPSDVGDQQESNA